MTVCYRVHGVTVAGPPGLPLMPGGGAATLIIGSSWAARGAADAVAAGRRGFDFDRVSGPSVATAMRVPGVGDFLVRGGSEILTDPSAQERPGYRLYLLGGALGMALHQKGALVLHAGAVAGPAGAVLLLGDRGAGKSTLAVAVEQRGAEVLSDDVVALWPLDGGRLVHAGPREAKLCRDAAIRLGRNDGAAVGGDVEKRYAALAATAPTHGLAEILTLGWGEGPHALPLRGRAALETLLRHTYRPRYLELLGSRATHFRAVTGLAGRIAMATLLRPRDIARLSEIADFLARRLGL
ncbi:MAG: hypothetical protein ACFBSD_08920 [Paracoccaceae bacterium]